MSILAMLLPSLAPAVIDGFRQLINKVTGAANGDPKNVQEAIALMQAQTDRVKALAEVDRLPDGASQWVINLRGAFRYVAIAMIVLITCFVCISSLYEPKLISILPILLDLTGACMSFIIGERMYLRLKGGNS